jgi:hypothetical protein
VSFRAGFAQAVPFPHWRFHWCRVPCLVALLLALLTPLPGCSTREEPSRPRVLLVGIDGASYSLARSLQEEGALPNLARLAEAGVFAPLRSIPPFLSPRIWNSIATGKTPDKHGIVSFAWPDAKNRNHLFLSSDRKSHALWNIASDAGLTVGVVNWWTTYPPEKINGVMVSDHALWSPHMTQPDVMTTSPSSTTGLVFPISWEERALALLKSELPLTAFPNPFAAPATSFPPGIDLDALRHDFEADAAIVRTALEIEAELHPDVMLVYLAGIDHASH